jgi:serine kinase of HPr protein (carbohydrate metabolism regulator)
MSASLSSETLHASCVAIGGRAVLIAGRSGTGKSDLALRLIDRGGTLVSDDYTIVRRVEGRLLARAPANIEGKLEVRGLGILAFEPIADVPVTLHIDLDRRPERMRQGDEQVSIAGVQLPSVAVAALEASAPIKVELALERLGSALTS